MCAMPQSSRMMVTLAASSSQRLTSGSPFAWSSAEEEDRNRRRRTRFFRQRQFFMRFLLRSGRHVLFLLEPRYRSVRRCEQFTCLILFPPDTPPRGGDFGRKVFVFNSLPGVAVCKILTTNELPAKYSI